MNPPPLPFSQVKLLASDAEADANYCVWLFAGSLERFVGEGPRYPFRQRVAFPEPAEWEQVREMGRWIVERLSINGHVLIGLHAWREGTPRETAQRIDPR